jgi:Polysaccharide pyruvyl transferase
MFISSHWSAVAASSFLSNSEMMENALSTAVEAESSSKRTSPGPARLKVFFVGDNRTSVNWGRGASLALGQLLSNAFEISGRVTGNFFDSSMAQASYVGTFMPPSFYHYMLSRRRRRSVACYIRLEQLFGARDFIAGDPRVTVDNLIAQKNRHRALSQIYDNAAQADLLVLDGDGDIIFSNPPRRQTLFLLAMIELGVRLKKPVFLVNSMISDCPLTGRNQTTLAAAKRLFTQCEAVALRDPESLAYVQKEIPQAKSCLIPDSLFTWFPLYQDDSSYPPQNGDFVMPHPEIDEYWGRLDFSRSYICIGGGALAGSQPDRAVQSYSRLIDEIAQLGYQICLTENDSSDCFLQRIAKEKGLGIMPMNAPILMCGAVLAHARLFISGRYHPSIFASLGGTPCIFLASHAHKMGSLPQILGYDAPRQFNAFPDDSEVAEIVSTAGQYLEQGQALRDRIKNVARLRSIEANALTGLLNRN